MCKSVLAAAAACLACAAGAHELVDFSRGGHGWRAANHVANARQTETGYAFDVTAGDPWCVSGGFIAFPSAANATYVRIELETAPVATPTSFELFWRGEKEPFSALRSVRLEPVGGNPCSTFAAKLPAKALDLSAPIALRIDPPGRSGTFAHVEYRRLRVEYMVPKWTPSFSTPPPLALGDDPFVLKGDGWELRHDRLRMGAFAFVANGKTWAEGCPDEPLVFQNAQGKPETLDWTRGSVRISCRDAVNNPQILEQAILKDPSGRVWRWARAFFSRDGKLEVLSHVMVDRPASVYHVPYLTLFVDRASGGHKRQALLPGVEYLADEPSSNEKEVRGPQANRLMPAAHKLCYPMMVLADESHWFAIDWSRSDQSFQPPIPNYHLPTATHHLPTSIYQLLTPVFDTPDRQFHSGGHLFALWGPGVGRAREESDTSLFAAVPFTQGAVLVDVATGVGGDVTDALAARLPLAKLPPTPALDAAKSCDVLARGWLDSAIREGTGCRHALGHWEPNQVSDAPALMLWLASATPDAKAAERLRTAAGEMIAALPEGSAERRGWGRSVSHVNRPAAPLVFGDPIAYAVSAGGTAKGIARQLADGRRIWHKPAGAKHDYGETLGADHCNGLTAMSASGMLGCALWTGDEVLIAEVLAVLDKFTETYGNDVPRGAQPWEMPLHTPDILASGHLVACYVRGYLLSGNPRYLERARYWARTGMAMVYFVDPPTDAPNPIGRYATIGVIGATNWSVPNWIGLPVQWCGLVYSAALSDLADVETDAASAALWRHLARGIAASGVDQSFLPSDGEKVGLLPDSFRLVEQVRRDPPINPGTVQENVSNFVGLPYYRVVRAVPDGKTLVHVPGRVTPMKPKAGELARVEIAAWPKAPYKVFFSRVKRPSAVKVDGRDVPFRFYGNVMAVQMQPGAKPAVLVLESAPQKARYTPDVAARPQARGVMLSQYKVGEDDFKTLRSWGATVARYQMYPVGERWKGKTSDAEGFAAWLDWKLGVLKDEALPLSRKYGIPLVVDLHVPPGGRGGSGMKMLDDPAWADFFVGCWRKIAARLKGEKGVYAYDLVNEPTQFGRPKVCDYLEIQRMAAAAVREIDPTTPIVVSCNADGAWCAPSAFKSMEPIGLVNIFYQFHMYEPFAYTHQKVLPQFKDTVAAYPDAAKGWDADGLRRIVAPVREFERRHGARIFVGEFSAVAYAKGCDRWIADVSAMLNEYGWDWCYHAFREWPGWSVEHEVVSGDSAATAKFAPSAGNPRMRALRAALKPRGTR